MHGLEVAKGDFIIIMDADLSHQVRNVLCSCCRVLSQLTSAIIKPKYIPDMIRCVHFSILYAQTLL